MENSLYLWTGSLIFAFVTAVSGNVAMRIMWRLSHRVKERIVHHDDKPDDSALGRRHHRQHLQKNIDIHIHVVYIDKQLMLFNKPARRS